MFKLIKSKNDATFFSFKEKEWVNSPSLATRYRPYNPIRFIAKLYVNKRFGKSEFHNLLSLKTSRAKKIK